ncbi:hypothetical protein MKX01_002691 [Papaver californicum]|nr:hypothetical protein MKX01_002691 [Papaver californicum]
MEDLVRGQELAKQVHMQLQGSEFPAGYNILDSVAKILEYFENAIANFSSSESTGEVCQSPALTTVDSPFSDGRKIEGTGEIRTVVAPEKIGSNKRRKTLDAREELTATPLDDGRAWRKYGHKEILNTRFPKSYFRCTHKKDQGCQAMKQYRVIYIGQHTCNDRLKGPRLLLDSNPCRHTCVLNFESNRYSPKLEFPFSPLFSSVKHEFKGNIKDTNITKANKNDFFKPSEFGDCNNVQTFSPSTSGSELVNGIAGHYSSAESNLTFDMDMMLDDDALQFDPSEFFNSS